MEVKSLLKRVQGEEYMRYPSISRRPSSFFGQLEAAFIQARRFKDI